MNWAEAYTAIIVTVILWVVLYLFIVVRALKDKP